MTEKSYGGNNGVREHTNKTIKIKPSPNINNKLINKKNKSEDSQIQSKSSALDDDKSDNSNLNELDSYKKAGEIAKKITEYAKSIIKPDMPLLEIARKIEKEIKEQGALPAFPVNLSINDIAAHYHPTIEDETKAHGLLKVDIGIHVNGFIADTAFSIDLTPEKKYTELIKASQDALEAALATLDKNPTLSEIGQAIQETIEKKGFSPIINLSGHELGNYKIHAGITIPNYANNNHNKLHEGAYAIEPFATTGTGKIYEGPASNIYAIINMKNTRSPTARKILEYVWEKYKTLPFPLRDIQEKFGAIARLAMKELEQNKIMHSYPQLIEVSHNPVSQAEHTFIKTPKDIIITTR